MASLVAQMVKNPPAESREGTRASRRVEEGLSRSFSGARGEALFRCARPSRVPRGPATSTGSLALEKGMATHSSILAWKIPWTEDSGGLQARVPRLLPGTLGNFPGCL